MKKTLIDVEGVPLGKTYSHAVRAGDLLFVTGQVPLDAQGRLVGRGDIRAQASQVYANLVAVLHGAGATVEDIVRVDSYYTDVEQRAAILEVRNRYFGAHRPCSTSVVVKSLADPDWLLEVQVIAALGSGAS